MLAARKADLITLRLAVKFKEKSRDNLPRLSLSQRQATARRCALSSETICISAQEA